MCFFLIDDLWNPHPNARRLKKTWPGKKSKVVSVLNLIKHYAMKAYGGVDV
jgi:hypothetical protein